MDAGVENLRKYYFNLNIKLCEQSFSYISHKMTQVWSILLLREMFKPRVLKW